MAMPSLLRMRHECDIELPAYSISIADSASAEDAHLGRDVVGDEREYNNYNGQPCCDSAWTIPAAVRIQVFRRAAPWLTACSYVCLTAAGWRCRPKRSARRWR